MLTPILFLVFNRLETTKRVFAQIRKARPRQLFIASDGARAGKEGEAQTVQAVRSYVLHHIDWDCEVKTLFQEQNIGCGRAVSQAITWFFEQVEQGIILEDDVEPDASFFPFCEELLARYRQDEQVFMISGYNKTGQFRDDYSYAVMQNPSSIWGWASWARAWRQYDFALETYRAQGISWDALPHLPAERRKMYEAMFDQILAGAVDTWDYQWAFAILQARGYSLTSNRNLICNLGLNEMGTHTSNWHLQVYEPPVYALPSPLSHPPLVHNKDFLMALERKRQEQQEGKYSRLKMLRLRLARLMRKFF